MRRKTTPRPPMLVMRGLVKLELYESACAALQEHYDKMGEAA